MGVWEGKLGSMGVWEYGSMGVLFKIFFGCYDYFRKNGYDFI
jgi:hypothetical protein